MPEINTGEIERRQQDVNPKSPTYLQFRWVKAGRDETLCPVGEVFNSFLIRETVYRDDCGANGKSTGVVYELPAGAVSDVTSQPDVDARARAIFNIGALDYARAHAQCVSGPSRPTVKVASYEFYDGKSWRVTIERSINTGTLNVEVTVVMPGGAIRTGQGQLFDGRTTGVVVVPSGQDDLGNNPQIGGVIITSVTPSDYDIIN
jgi:hypothetical protein